MAEPLAPSFRTEAPKPRNVVERVKNRVSPEQIKKRRMEKAVERRKRSVPATRVANMEATRRQKGRALNLEKDTAFDLAVFQEKRRFLTQHGLSREVSGNTYQLSPTEEAGIRDRAYAELANSNPGLVDYYRREGLYFGKADHDGNCPIDFRADPFRRAVEQQAQELRTTGDDTGANIVLDSFARDCRDKAEMYAAAGDKGMQEALLRIGPRDVDTSAAVVGPNKQREAGKTVNLAEQEAQETKRQLNRMVELAKADPKTLKAADLNELKTLEAQHKQGIDDAQRLNIQLRTPGSAALNPQDLAKLEPYEDYIMAQNADRTIAAQQAVAAGTTPSPDALKAQTEQQKRTLGSEAIGKLKDRNIDITQMTEAQVLHALKDGAILDPNGDKWIDNPDTQAYIRGAFAEQQMQQAEATLATIPQATIDKLVADNGLKKEDILGILLALLASGVISSIPKLP